MNNQDESNNEIAITESTDNIMTTIPIVNIINNQNSNVQNPANDGIQLTGEMQVELNRLNDKLKLLLPFIILVLLKYLLDNFITGLIVIINFYILYKIQLYFSIQLSLKDRSNKNILISLLISVVCLLSIDLFLISILFNNGTLLIFERLQLKYPTIKSNISFLSIIWYCFITDGLLQMLSIILKLVVCIMVGSKNYFDPTKCRMNTIFSSRNTTNIHSISLRMHGNNQNNDSYDIENGNISIINVNSMNENRHNSNIAFTTLSNLSSSITGLVRRSLLHQSQYRQQQQQHNHNYREEHDINNDSTAAIIHDDATSSDADIDEIQSRQSSSESYLIRLRLCTLIDMMCLIYRTIIPIPLWSYYFATSKIFGIGLKLTYIFIKLLDLSWKTKGIIVAFDIFFRNKLVNNNTILTIIL